MLMVKFILFLSLEIFVVAVILGSLVLGLYEIVTGTVTKREGDKNDRAVR